MKKSEQQEIKSTSFPDMTKTLSDILKWILMFVIVAEFVRKNALHYVGTPFFVLDSEPLLTSLSYGKISIVILLLVLLYIGYDFLEQKCIRIILVVVALILGLPMIFFIFTQEGPKWDLIYVNKEYRVYQKSFASLGDQKYTEVYLSDKTTPFVFCLNWILQDNCADSVEQLQKQISR